MAEWWVSSPVKRRSLVRLQLNSYEFIAQLVRAFSIPAALIPQDLFFSAGGERFRVHRKLSNLVAHLPYTRSVRVQIPFFEPYPVIVYSPALNFRRSGQNKKSPNRFFPGLPVAQKRVTSVKTMLLKSIDSGFDSRLRHQFAHLAGWASAAFPHTLASCVAASHERANRRELFGIA